MGFLLSVLRGGYQVGKAVSDVAEKQVRKAKKSKAFIDRIDKYERQLDRKERMLRNGMNDEQREQFENARAKLNWGREVAENWRNEEFVREAYEMTAKQFAKAINHSSGDLREIYLEIAKKRGDVEYRSDKGKYKAKKY